MTRTHMQLGDVGGKPRQAMSQELCECGESGEDVESGSGQWLWGWRDVGSWERGLSLQSTVQ